MAWSCCHLIRTWAARLTGTLTLLVLGGVAVYVPTATAQSLPPCDPIAYRGSLADVYWAEWATLPVGRPVQLFEYFLYFKGTPITATVDGGPPLFFGDAISGGGIGVSGVFETTFDTPGPKSVTVTAEVSHSQGGIVTHCALTWQRTLNVGTGGVVPGSAPARFRLVEDSEGDGETWTLAYPLPCAFYRPSRLVVTLRVAGRKPWRNPVTSLCKGMARTAGGDGWSFGWDTEDTGPALAVFPTPTRDDSSPRLPFSFAVSQGRRTLAKTSGVMIWNTIITANMSLGWWVTEHEQAVCSLMAGSIEWRLDGYVCRWTSSTAGIGRRR